MQNASVRFKLPRSGLGGVTVRSKLFLVAAVLSLPVVAGCSFTSKGTDNTPKPPPASSTLATADMWPSMSAQSYDGATIKVYAAVLKDSDFVLLDGQDYFTATIGGQTIVLQEEPYTSGGAIHYTASFASPQTNAATVTIAFVRPAQGMQGAPQSTTVVPAPFNVAFTAPPSVKLGSALSFQITPAPAVGTSTTERMTIAVNGDCLQDHDPYPLTVDAQGNASFSTSVLQLKQGTTSGCDIGLQVRHEYTGTADPAFKNAQTNGPQGLQARNFNTSIVP
jgi:hypothetical protein